LTGTNALAYYETAYLTAVKSFITPTPGQNPSNAFGQVGDVATDARLLVVQRRVDDAPTDGDVTNLAAATFLKNSTFFVG
jgi:hypothetical protein